MKRKSMVSILVSLIAVTGLISLFTACPNTPADTVTALLEQKFLITVTQPEHGEIKVSPALPSDNKVAKDKELTFELSAASGYIVKELVIDGTKYTTVADNKITQKVTVKKAIEVTGVVEKDPSIPSGTETFPVTVTNPANGAITVTPNLPTDNKVAKDTELTFELSAASGYIVKELVIDGTKYTTVVDNKITEKVTVTKAIEVTGVVEEDPSIPPGTEKFLVTVTKPANGTITVTPILPTDNKVAKDKELTFELSADSGYIVKELVIDGTKYTTVVDNKITEKVTVTKAIEVTGVVEKNVEKFSVKVTQPAHGKITVDPELPTDHQVAENTELTFELSADPDYIVKELVIDGTKYTTVVGNKITETVTVKKAIEVTGLVEKNAEKFLITITQPENGTITVSPALPSGNMALKNDKYVFTLSAKPGFFVESLKVGGRTYTLVSTDGTIKSDEVTVTEALEISGTVTQPVLKEIRVNYAPNKTVKITDFDTPCPEIKTVKDEISVFIVTTPNTVEVQAAGLVLKKTNPADRMYSWALSQKNNTVTITTCGKTYTLNAERFIEVGDIYISGNDLDKGIAAKAAAATEAPQLFTVAENKGLIQIGEHDYFKKEYNNVKAEYTINSVAKSEKLTFADDMYTHIIQGLPADETIDVLLTVADTTLSGCDLQYKFQIKYEAPPSGTPADVEIGEIWVGAGTNKKFAAKAEKDTSDPSKFRINFLKPTGTSSTAYIWYVGANDEAKKATVTKVVGSGTASTDGTDVYNLGGGKYAALRETFKSATASPFEFKAIVENNGVQQEYTLEVTYYDTPKTFSIDTSALTNCEVTVEKKKGFNAWEAISDISAIQEGTDIRITVTSTSGNIKKLTVQQLNDGGDPIPGIDFEKTPFPAGPTAIIGGTPQFVIAHNLKLVVEN